MQYRKYKAIGSRLPGLCILEISSRWEGIFKAGEANTVETALMIFLNVTAREHKEAQLDIMRCIVHTRVDDKNVSKYQGWGSNSDQTI